VESSQHPYAANFGEMDSTTASSMCKIFAIEMAERVCSHAIQILGGQGYTRKWPLEKYLRDVKPLQIYEGTNPDPENHYQLHALKLNTLI
jgi:alkylation response protein AidB-like acyl-CoA dehydrogenase